MKSIYSIASALVLGTLVTGCATNAYEPPTMQPTTKLMESSARSVKISLAGDILAATPKEITVDMLDKLPQTEYAVNDPYAHKKVTYRGVLLRDLVKAWCKSGIKRVEIRAIDDFHATITREEWSKWDVLLATRKDGQKMSIANNGPVRIAFPYDTHPEINPVIYNDKWIWQINRMEFID